MMLWEFSTLLVLLDAAIAELAEEISGNAGMEMLATDWGAGNGWLVRVLSEEAQAAVANARTVVNLGGEGVDAELFAEIQMRLYFPERYV